MVGVREDKSEGKEKKEKKVQCSPLEGKLRLHRLESIAGKVATQGRGHADRSLRRGGVSLRLPIGKRFAESVSRVSVVDSMGRLCKSKTERTWRSWHVHYLAIGREWGIRVGVR